MSNWSRHLAQYLAILIATVIVVGPAQAQTKLKWAHVYEVAEPYHANALWAAEEIKKRTGGRYEIGVFPASQLGNENQINEGLGLGTVDIIYTGASFAGSIHKPLAITGAPFILRDLDHWKAYRDSQLFRDLAKGYDDKTRHKVVAILYYGQRQRNADRFCRSLPCAPARHRRRPGKPAADHHGEEVLRSSVAHHADRPHHRIPCHHCRRPCLVQAFRCGQEGVRRGAEGSQRPVDGSDPRIRAQTRRRIPQAW